MNTGFTLFQSLLAGVGSHQDSFRGWDASGFRGGQFNGRLWRQERRFVTSGLATGRPFGFSDVQKLIHQPALQGVTRQFDVGRQAHLVRNPGAVSAHGFLAEREFSGNFLDGFAGRDHPQDL